ncbi:MAG: EscU/YscU/HrcU family type III secretion system export apparatus switch protein [Bacillota bacterium]|nr:EscU/YscU/HrcU family type III secretion system export apparatus switch protein [Bacillota bacterium]
MKKEKKAIALAYDENYQAPVVSAKGIGFVADEIIKKAEESQVPVIIDQEMAALLSKVDIGDYIPEELYQAAAEILVFIINLDKEIK